MNHGQNLRDLLEPLGVYRWEGSFQWGELQSEGAALDGVADANDALRGCGIPAVVEETETKQVVAVSFPGVVGVPEDFARRKERVEAILPCHLQVEYRFAETE